MEKKRAFGELELAILQIFRTNEKQTVRSVLDSLKGNDKYTTIMTVMNRMVEKKMLIRQIKGQQYEYWLNESYRKATLSNFLNKIKQKIFGGRSASMVSYLLESGDDITDDEIEKMEKMIKKIKERKHHDSRA